MNTLVDWRADGANVVGLTWDNWQQIIISWGAIGPGAVMHNVIAHEFGHGVGLAVGTNHAGYVPPQIMSGTAGTGNVELLSTDVSAYDGGP